jgi:hypothetical protein
MPIPNWVPWENAGAGVALADLNGDGHPDIVVLMVDNPPGPNAGYYRVGRDLDQAGNVSGWGPWQQVPNWFPWENSDAGIAVADINGNGRPDVIVFMIDNPPGQNSGWYRIGWDVDADGAPTGGWSPWMQVPDWFPWENQGGDIAVADLDGDGRPELVVVMVDNPPGQNAGYYRVGWKLDATGAVTGGWSPWTPVPDWFPWENQGAGCAIGDLSGNGHHDLLVFQVDNPPGQNGGYYTVGWRLDATGRAADGWGPWTAVPNWRFWENQGAAVALTPRGGGGKPDVVVLTIDNPPGQNEGHYRVLPLITDLDTAATHGVWRLLDFDSQVLAINAALLHTGDVLVFSGSSNNPANLAAHQSVRGSGTTRRPTSAPRILPSICFASARPSWPMAAFWPPAGPSSTTPSTGCAAPSCSTRPPWLGHTRRTWRAAAGTRRCWPSPTGGSSPSPASARTAT